MICLYILKVIVCSGLLFGYYQLVLKNKAFHQYNRFFLLISTVLAIVMPLINVPVDLFKGRSNESLTKTLQVITSGGWEKEFIITAQTTFVKSRVTIQNIIACIYLTGLIFFLLPVIKSFLLIRRLSKKYDKEVINNIGFYNTVEAGTPFSFFKAIFWNSKIPLESKEGQYIIRHELYHIRKKHSYDLILLQCLSSLLWFNPFFHLIKTELQTIHEFLADRYASAHIDKYLYAELLISHAIQNKRIAISNPFFNNQIKRRIAMITANHTNRYQYLARVMALPMLFVIFCAFSLRINQHSNFTFSQKAAENDTVPAIDLLKIKFDEKQHISMYTSKDVIVFKFEKGDSLIVKTDDFMALAEKIKKDKSSDAEMIFTKVENEAAYPGGASAWLAYLNRTFRYPKEAIDNKVQGTVTVQFIVDKDGTVSDVKAISGPTNGGLREEAIRNIQNSGKWVPAKQNGNTIKSFKMQPFTFKLEQ